MLRRAAAISAREFKSALHLVSVVSGLVNKSGNVETTGAPH